MKSVISTPTIKIPGIQEEYRGFSCFFTGNENGAKVILGQFWASASKNRFLGTPSGAAGRAFLCLLPEEHVCDALGSSGFIFLDDVGIEVLRGVYAGVAQLLRWDTTFSGAVYPICHVPKLLLILDSFCWIDNGHRLAALVLIGKGQRRSLGKQSGKRKHPLTLAAAGIALQQCDLAGGDIRIPQPAHLLFTAELPICSRNAETPKP